MNLEIQQIKVMDWLYNVALTGEKQPLELEGTRRQMTILNCDKCGNKMDIEDVRKDKNEVLFWCRQCAEADTLYTDNLSPYIEIMNERKEYADGDKYHKDNFYMGRI